MNIFDGLPEGLEFGTVPEHAFPYLEERGGCGSIRNQCLMTEGLGVPTASLPVGTPDTGVLLPGA